MDLHLKSTPKVGEVDWTEISLLSLGGPLEVGPVTGWLSLRRNRRGAQLEMRPDAANLDFTPYDEEGKFAYVRPGSWRGFAGGTLMIDGLPMAQMQWAAATAWPGELRDGWDFATMPVLACNLSHEATDPLFEALRPAELRGSHLGLLSRRRRWIRGREHGQANRQ